MKHKTAYSVLVVEDEPLIRENLVKKLRENCPGFEVVGEAADGREALESLSELCPDVLVTDIRMPVMDGMQLIREAYYAFPEVHAVIVSGFDEFEYAKTAIVHGVKDYLLKPVSAADLRATFARLAVHLDAEHERFESEHPSAPGASQEELVRTVQEYLRAHFAEEVSLGDIAVRFHVSPPYLSRLFKRLAGAAPARYLRDLRITSARKLLDERRDLEIKEIGVLAGYPDQGYFSRIFKQSVGVSPQEYRERRGHRDG